jgi:hypothetical protein
LVLGWFAAHQRPRASIVEVELVWGCCERWWRTRQPPSSRGGVGLVGPTLCPAVEKAPSATGVVPSRGISLGWQCLWVLYLRVMSSTSRRAITAWSVRQSGAHISAWRVDPTIGTARDRGVRTSRWKAPRADGGVMLFAGHVTARGSETRSIVPAVLVLGLALPGQCRQRYGSPTSRAPRKGFFRCAAGSLPCQGV